eukprot:SAG31_NODE_14787_length_787_cov_1.632267_1_plen_112_part_00
MSAMDACLTYITYYIILLILLRYVGDGCVPAPPVKATGFGSALAMKRSDDFGRTWHPDGGQIVVPEGYDESAVFDSTAGAVVLLFPKQPIPGSDVANSTNERRTSTVSSAA